MTDCVYTIRVRTLPSFEPRPHLASVLKVLFRKYRLTVLDVRQEPDDVYVIPNASDAQPRNGDAPTIAASRAATRQNASCAESDGI